MSYIIGATVCMLVSTVITYVIYNYFKNDSAYEHIDLCYYPTGYSQLGGLYDYERFAKVEDHYIYPGEDYELLPYNDLSIYTESMDLSSVLAACASITVQDGEHDSWRNQTFVMPSDVSHNTYDYLEIFHDNNQYLPDQYKFYSDYGHLDDYSRTQGIKLLTHSAHTSNFDINNSWPKSKERKRKLISPMVGHLGNFQSNNVYSDVRKTRNPQTDIELTNYVTPSDVIYNQEEYITPSDVVYNQEEYITPSDVVYNQEEYITPSDAVYNQEEYITPSDAVYNQEEHITPPDVVYNQEEYITPSDVVYNQEEYITPSDVVYNQEEYITPSDVVYNQEEYITPSDAVYNQEEYITPSDAVYNQEEYITPSDAVYNQEEYITPSDAVYNQEEYITPSDAVYNQEEYITPLDAVYNQEEYITPLDVVYVTGKV
ncbi:hypothetical protein Btru_073267 [Bulinus truncatus]|nr:hypothetical protein Btru_073267 [Bulinus truncatus]